MIKPDKAWKDYNALANKLRSTISEIAIKDLQLPVLNRLFLSTLGVDAIPMQNDVDNAIIGLAYDGSVKVIVESDIIPDLERNETELELFSPAVNIVDLLGLLEALDKRDKDNF